MSTQHRTYIPISFHRIDIREGANTHKAIWCKYLSRSVHTEVNWISRQASAFLFLDTHLYLVFLKIVAQRVVRLSVSVSHDRYSHAGNYIGLPSNTALFLSTGNKYLFLFQYHLIPCDSWPLHLFRFSHVWRQNIAIEVSDLFFFQPLFSISDNWASRSSGEIPRLHIQYGLELLRLS